MHRRTQQNMSKRDLLHHIRRIGIIADTSNRRNPQANPAITIGQHLGVTKDKSVTIDHRRGVEFLVHRREIGLVFKRHGVHVQREHFGLGYDRGEIRPRLADGIVVGQGRDEVPQLQEVVVNPLLEVLDEAGFALQALDLGGHGHDHQVSHGGGGVYHDRAY